MTTKEKNFEQSLERLNTIVERLEGGDLSLEESLKLYEEGVRLSQECSKRLENAQTRIEVLLRHADGGLKTADADPATLKPKPKKKKS